MAVSSVFFALFILTTLNVFVLPKNIGGNAAYAGFVSLMKQFFKCVAAARDRLARGACGVLRRCDVGG